jgi:hypothetical protein
MIILPEQKAVIITPPKTASSSLYKHLCDNLRLGIIVEGPQGDRLDIGRHTTFIPHPYNKYDVYCTCVEDRFLKLYKHYIGSHDFISFEQYVKVQPKLNWFYNWSLENWSRYAHFLPDTAIMIVKRLGISVEDFPCINVSKFIVTGYDSSLVPDNWR